MELINHVQASFHMEQEKHDQLLEIATMKEVSADTTIVGYLFLGHLPFILSYDRLVSSLSIAFLLGFW